MTVRDNMYHILHYQINYAALIYSFPCLIPHLLIHPLQATILFSVPVSLTCLHISPFRWQAKCIHVIRPNRSPAWNPSPGPMHLMHSVIKTG